MDKDRYTLATIGSIIVILSISLFIRIAPVITNPESTRLGRGVFGDTWAYHNIAYNIARVLNFSNQWTQKALY